MFDFFKTKFYKQRMEELELKLSEINKTITPEMKDAVKLQEKVTSLENRISELTLRIYT